MIYQKSFEQDHIALIPLLTSCAHLHSDPMIYTDLSGNVVGCNSILMALMNAASLKNIAPVSHWFFPHGVDFSYILSNSGNYRGNIEIGGVGYDVAIKSEVIWLENTPIIGVIFRDMSVIERAHTAERYFEQLKNKFLTNISHEFRTPMNAIIGFSDLLKDSPLNVWQEEYVQMMSLSAQSMMRNIENLLEMMQVESGSIHVHSALFNPLDVYENFVQQFFDVALSKEISLMFLIDPNLPKTMMGDQDKILAILRNLIQNSLKFTAKGGRILVEVLIVKEENNFMEVEYAVSDTGCGIEQEKMKTLLRPFASAWANQHRAHDGLGIGLGLSHKYVDMMDSHLMLASESGKGSRFSYRIKHQVNEKASFDFVKGSRAVIYTSEHKLTAQGALLYKYLELFHMETKSIYDLVNPILHQSDVLFLDMPNISKSQIDAIKSTYPHLNIVPILKLDDKKSTDLSIEPDLTILRQPILPNSLYKILTVIWRTLPKELIVRSQEMQPISHDENIKILIAEDNLINLKLLETILLHEHFRVIAVDNGQKAVDAYLKEHFDLVLMDIDMPIMDGLMANRLIKEIDKRDKRGFVPVIALTAHALVGDRERIMAAGLDAHLAKPIDKYFLLQMMDRYLKIAQQKRQSNAV
ncbi:response regulator [Sulfuricurvum sp.]|uniref:response regulator n=1 Tax=Sulfuricurvum sp. TaxID=2025608 RepID=UPI003BB7A1CA